MKITLFHLAASALLVGAIPSAAAQAIDMSQSHSTTVVSRSTTPVSGALEPASLHHIKVPTKTRMAAHRGANGQLRAVCTVETNPRMIKPHDPFTHTVPRLQ